MTFLALTLAPASASAASSHASAAHDAAKACTKAPVEIVAGSTTAKVALARCDGAAVPASVVQLSALARPAAATKAHKIDPRVVERLEVVADHFRKDGQVPRIVLVPGNKPRTSGSLHASGRALDFKIEGVPNEDVVAFCKTMTDTGCGFYPTAGFVHVDVREHGIGHVSWIDVSKPGEAPRYVSSWPPPGEASPAREHEKAELHAAAGKKGADVNVVAAADEPKLPPLPAAAQFAPLESPKVAAPAETPKVAAAPEVVVTTTTAAATAKDPAPKEPEAKDAARKTASKKEGRKGKRRHHRHAAEATDATHPTVQNPS